MDEFIKTHSWLIRPCSLYEEEYSDCTSISSRFHQRFIKGEFEECTAWKRDYKNCILWTEENNEKAFKELVESETQRRNDRLKAHLANDVWEKRTGPPPDWNAPLPELIQKRIQNSYLAIKNEEIKKGVQHERTLCVIS